MEADTTVLFAKSGHARAVLGMHAICSTEQAHNLGKGPVCLSPPKQKQASCGQALHYHKKST